MDPDEFLWHAYRRQQRRKQRAYRRVDWAMIGMLGGLLLITLGVFLLAWRPSV
jgi:hypothetical protein